MRLNAFVIERCPRVVPISSYLVCNGVPSTGQVRIILSPRSFIRSIIFQFIIIEMIKSIEPETCWILWQDATSDFVDAIIYCGFQFIWMADDFATLTSRHAFGFEQPTWNVQSTWPNGIENWNQLQNDISFQSKDEAVTFTINDIQNAYNLIESLANKIRIHKNHTPPKSTMYSFSYNHYYYVYYSVHRNWPLNFALFSTRRLVAIVHEPRPEKRKTEIAACRIEAIAYNLLGPFRCVSFYFFRL